MVLNWNEEKTTASSSDESYDSDKVDSDIEAELYSIIHHQQETHLLTSEEEKSLNSSSMKNNIACVEDPNVSIDNFISNRISVGNANVSIDNFISNRISVRNANVSIDNFISDRISDCDLYKNFEQQNSFSNQELCQNSNSLKRKSNTFTECLNDAQISTSSFNLQNIQCEGSKRKKSKQNISHFSETNSDANVTNKLDTSDSDSDIIFLKPSDNEKLFQTNLSVNTVTINSDSEDSMPPFFQHSSSFNRQNIQRTSHADFTSKKSLEELWFVNDEDLGRFKRNSGRYHESGFTYCSKCTQRGHTARFCSYTKFVRCFLCGGKHSPARCKRRTCCYCFERAHDVRNCRRFLQSCANCHMRGHGHKECPDIWRKYHLTTSKKFVASQRLPQDTSLYCFNCGLQGHFGASCTEQRIDKFSSLTWPSLIDYNSPMISDSQENSLELPKSLSLQRYSKEKREKILLRRKRRKELRKAKRASFSKEIYFPRTPKNQFKKSRNLKNSVDPNSSSQVILSGKALQSKKSPNFNLNNSGDQNSSLIVLTGKSKRTRKRMERLQRKKLMYQEMNNSLNQ